MLTRAPRAPAARTELDHDLDATFDAVLAVAGLERVLAALARAAERMRLSAHGTNTHVEQSYDVVQGRLELAAEDLAAVPAAQRNALEVATSRVA